MARPALIPAGKAFSAVAAIAAYSEDQLLTLLSARPDLAEPPPKDLAVLAARAASWSSIEACRTTLNRGCSQMLDALCLLPQPTTVARLTELLATDVDEGDVDAALCLLADRALVFRQGQEVRLHPQLYGQHSPAGLGPPLSVALPTQQAQTLDALARRLGAKHGPTKADTMATLIRVLSDPDQVGRALVNAPAGTSELAALLSQHAFGNVPSGAYSIRPESSLGWLAGRGFIFATDWNTVVMPREVGLALRGGRPYADFSLDPPPLQWSSVDADRVDRAGVEQALRAVTDIAAILDSWEDAPPKLLKAGGVGIRDIRRAATAVGRSEVDTARLIELATIAGLAGWDKEASAALPCPAYDEWLELAAPQRWLALATSWLAADVHVDLAGATGTNGKPIPPMLPRWGESISRQRRRTVLRALLLGEPGQAANPDGLRARALWDAAGIWSDGPATGPTLVAWVVEEAQMLGISAQGALTALGRLAVTGRFDEAVTELSGHTPPVTSQFVIQADLTIVATGPLTTLVRADLEEMADLESSGAATVYRVGEQSLRRAFDGGWTAEAIIGFLDVHATKGIPQPLTYLVDDVGRRHGRVRLGSASCYIRSDEPTLLAEILVTRKAAKLGLRQLAPTVLVSPVDPETVIETLRSTGYLPAEEDTSGELLIRRREIRRADESYGPLSARSFDPDAGRTARFRAAELTDLLAHPGGGSAFAPTPPPDRATKQRDLERLVERLRSAGASAGSGSQPPSATLPRHLTEAPISAIRAQGPLSQLELLPDDDSDRPIGIVTSTVDVLELLDLAFENDWWVQLEHVNRRGAIELLDVTLFSIDGTTAVVGTMHGWESRTLAINMINWARVMTAAEEAEL